MSNERQTYLAYLLRLWWVGEQNPSHSQDLSGWRASLECPHGGQRMGFASLTELFTFLECRVAEVTESFDRFQATDNKAGASPQRRQPTEE